MSDNNCRKLIPNSGITSKAAFSECTYAVYEVSKEKLDKEDLADVVKKLAEGAWNDFVATNKHLGGKTSKFAGSLVVGGTVAASQGAKTPLGWAASRFGALPVESVPYRGGSLQVLNLSTGARLGRVLVAAGTKFVIVTVAFEGGVLIGSMINQLLSEDTQMSIGGTLNEIFNEGGYADLWRHPFGIGM